MSVWNRLIVKLAYGKRLSALARKLQYRDDFEWATYTRHYVDPNPNYTQLLSRAGFRVDGTRIVLPPEALPLHDNHALIYETALALGVTSAFEFGFGGGYHLANLRALLPDAALGGVDVSAQQREFALKTCGDVFSDRRNPIWNELRDMTRADAATDLQERAELVYCQAVLMHIHGGDRPTTFLRNMWRTSRRYVLLVENWRRDDYVTLLRGLFPEQRQYLLRHGRAGGILLDKQNAAPFPLVQSDAQMRAFME